MQLDYSFIIPVYDRPEEIRELLQSMSVLEFNQNFEVVIVEDGSSIPCEEVIQEFQEALQINYFLKENTGPGDSRNFGMRKAGGNYFIILDSDVILPPQYLQKVDNYLSENYVDCYGGPDAAHKSFSKIQKAINYSMTSFFTTGGIRGGSKAVSKFQPRSFNMGISKEAFVASGGFGRIHPGEDPDLSLRLEKLQFKTALIPNAEVFHKRRIDWGKFKSQVHKFGLVRPVLNKWHPESAKITYWFPSVFISGFVVAIILALLGVPFLLYIFMGYFIIIAVDASIQNKSVYIGMAAVVATVIQFWGYGTGFLNSIWKLQFLKLEPEVAFPKLFFKDAEKK